LRHSFCQVLGAVFQGLEKAPKSAKPFPLRPGLLSAVLHVAVSFACIYEVKLVRYASRVHAVAQ
jgi:hypothetical protein